MEDLMRLLHIYILNFKAHLKNFKYSLIVSSVPPGFPQYDYETVVAGMVATKLNQNGQFQDAVKIFFKKN